MKIQVPKTMLMSLFTGAVAGPVSLVKRGDRTQAVAGEMAYEGARQNEKGWVVPGLGIVQNNAQRTVEGDIAIVAGAGDEDHALKREGVDGQAQERLAIQSVERVHTPAAVNDQSFALLVSHMLHPSHGINPVALV